MERINSYAAKRGPWSRREFDRLVADGRVTVNDLPATQGQMVTDDDIVCVDQTPVEQNRSTPTYYILNKPVGWISTTDTTCPDNVLMTVPSVPRVFPVGRLDVASSGLLILTNDGELTIRLTHPRYQHEKEYEVSVAQPLSDEDLQQFRSGMLLDGEFTLPAKVKRLSETSFRIALRQGRNRQIRRMCEARQYDITWLKRIRIASLLLDNLPVGQWRPLLPEEIHRLRQDVGLPPIMPPPTSTSPS